MNIGYLRPILEPVYFIAYKITRAAAGLEDLLASSDDSSEAPVQLPLGLAVDAQGVDWSRVAPLGPGSYYRDNALTCVSYYSTQGLPRPTDMTGYLYAGSRSEPEGRERRYTGGTPRGSVDSPGALVFCPGRWGGIYAARLSGLSGGSGVVLPL